MIKLGLMNDAESSNELTVNYLMKMALEKVKLGVQSSGSCVYFHSIPLLDFYTLTI